MAHVTFDALVKMADMKGLEIERVSDTQIDIWVKNDSSVTAECSSVREAYSTIYYYVPGEVL